MSFGNPLVLGCDIADASPTLVPVLTLQSTTQTVQLEPLLLNPGEEFHVHVTLSSKPTFTCEGRIVGSRVRRLATGDPAIGTVTWVATLLFPVALLAREYQRTDGWTT